MTASTAPIALNVLIIFWLLVCGGATFYARRILRHARDARIWFRSRKLNGYREIVASGAIARGRVRVFMGADMVLMGITASASQFFPPGDQARHVISALFRLEFIIMAIAFAYKSYLEDHELDLLVAEDKRVARRAELDREAATRHSTSEVWDG